jgi:hypothetical protein
MYGSSNRPSGCRIKVIVFGLNFDTPCRGDRLRFRCRAQPPSNDPVTLVLDLAIIPAYQRVKGLVEMRWDNCEDRVLDFFTLPASELYGGRSSKSAYQRRPPDEFPAPSAGSCACSC